MTNKEAHNNRMLEINSRGQRPVLSSIQEPLGKEKTNSDSSIRIASDSEISIKKPCIPHPTPSPDMEISCPNSNSSNEKNMEHARRKEILWNLLKMEYVSFVALTNNSICETTMLYNRDSSK